MATWGKVYDGMVDGLRTHWETMIRLQEQMTGDRISRASDAPVDAYQIMKLTTSSSEMETFVKNLVDVNFLLGESSSVLSTISGEIFTGEGKLSELLEQAASDTVMEQRPIIAEAINSLLDTVVSLVNGDLVGRYYFSGEKTGTVPFVVHRDADKKITSVNYQGGVDSLDVPVGPGTEQSGTLVGSEIFQNNERTKPEFVGNTGVQAGLGDTTILEDVTLIVQHGETTFETGSGIVAGSRSPAIDTIVGTNHVLIVNTVAQNVKLDDGAVVDYSAGDISNLQLTNLDGDIVYVNMENVAVVGAAVEVAITATAKLSIDDGLSMHDVVAFSNNEAVVDSQTDRVLYLDTRLIERTGTELVTAPVQTSYDLFDTLIIIRDTLSDTELSLDDFHTKIGQLKESYQVMLKDFETNLASVGAKWQVMGSLQVSMEDIQWNISDRLNAIQEVDFAKITSELVQSQVFYEMLLAATARLANLSLMDYLR